MNFMNRAWLYIVRKRGKSILLFVILLVMATFVLTALALGNASKAAQQELRQSLGGSFLIGFDYTENNPYLKVESVDGGTLMYSTQQISPELVEQIREGDQRVQRHRGRSGGVPLSGTVYRQYPH